MNTYQAFVVEQTGENEYSGSVKELNVQHLPAGDVLVQVAFSSLNYKDALSASGNRGVTRKYPHTPGIDAAGIVKESSVGQLNPGDQVIVTSYDLGMNTNGGFGQYIRIPANWVVKLPAGLTLKESMIYGTAGFTAGMAIHEIVKNTQPVDGEILVTGASGGVGSMAVAILSKLGYKVVAVSGKPSAREYLETIGASVVISREEILAHKERPLLKPRWAGVVDTVGGEILANAIKSANPLAVVAACGNVAAAEIPINVFPFILRGVKLIGIDSQNCPMVHRSEIWQKLASDWKPENLLSIATEVKLHQLQPEINKILKGEIIGRTVINLD